MKAVFTGSFDPITYGHIDLIKRSLCITNQLTVLVLNNSAKKTLFTLDQRLSMLKEETKEYKGINVDCYDGLLVDYLKKQDIHLIIRGVRSVTDYEYEVNISLVNKTIWEDVETIFLPASPKYMHISSSIAKEIASLGGDLKDIVPPSVRRYLNNFFCEQR